jgi:hypothetical protein
MLNAGPVSNMASQQEKAFSVLRFKVSRSVIGLELLVALSAKRYQQF